MFKRDGGCFEVTYAVADDMDPRHQQKLLEALERGLAHGPVSVLFVVHTLSVPREVPEFWFRVTKQLAPKLCAIAVISDSLAVRAAASGFSVSNKVRRVKVNVKAYQGSELEAAREWCASTRAALSKTG